MATAVTALNTSQLIADVLAQEMERDPRIVVLGEDVGELGGVFGATRRLKKTFGEERVRETPISEAAFIGLAVGAAQAGLRPVVELMFVDFLGVCFDQIMNQMAKNTYMSGGRVAVPLVLRTAVGSIGAAAQHSQVLSATFAHIPGLKVAYPATPGDACGLLRAAIADDNPVGFLEHKLLLKTRIGELAWAEDVDGSDQPAPFGKVRVLRDGSDVVIVSAGFAVQHSIRAAEALADDGISAGGVDVRTLLPLGRDRGAESASRSAAVLVVDEDYRDYGMCGEVIASITERLGPGAPRFARHAPDAPLPANKALEEALLPGAESIASAAHSLLGAV